MAKPRATPKAPLIDQWRSRIDAWTRSGLSARAFAAQHGIGHDSLYWWRRRLRDAPPAASTPAPRLVPVTFEAPTLCELVLRSGRLLRFPARLAPSTLRDLLVALEAP